MERFLRLFRLSRDVHEIDALSDRDLADLGVSRIEALQLASLPDDVPVRVREMATLFGIPSAELLADRRLWHELLHSCNQCADVALCHRLIARPEPEEPVDTASLTFCPNRATFERLSQALAA